MRVNVLCGTVVGQASGLPYIVARPRHKDNELCRHDRQDARPTTYGTASVLRGRLWLAFQSAPPDPPESSAHDKSAGKHGSPHLSPRGKQ